MSGRRARLTDFSIPLGIAGILAIVALWGWRVALIVVAVGVVASTAGLALLPPWRAHPRGTTMETENRPLLVYLYSPY